MREGEPGSFAAVILEGEVDVFVSLPTGPVQMATVGRNRIIGELGVFTDMPRSATVIARTDIVVARIEQHSLMRLSAEYPSIAVAIIHELGGRLARMNRSLAYLTYAAEALGRDEYDSALLDKLTNLPGELANFGRAFAGMASEIRAKQTRRAEMRAAAEIQQSILPPPWTPDRPGSLRRSPCRDAPGARGRRRFLRLFPDRREPARVHGRRRVRQGHSGRLVHGRLAHRHARHQRQKRPERRYGGGQPAARDAEHRLHVRDAVSRRARPDDRRAALLQCRSQPALSAARRRRSLVARSRPGSRSASRIGSATASPRPFSHPGDTLFLFSDGITEAFDAAGNEFGTARLEQTLEAARGCSAADLVRQVLARDRRLHRRGRAVRRHHLPGADLPRRRPRVDTSRPDPGTQSSATTCYHHRIGASERSPQKFRQIRLVFYVPSVTVRDGATRRGDQFPAGAADYLLIRFADFNHCTSETCPRINRTGSPTDAGYLSASTTFVQIPAVRKVGRRIRQAQGIVSRPSAPRLAQSQDVAVSGAAVIETVHQLAHQMDAETARLPLLKRQRQVGIGSAGRIERPAVVDDLRGHVIGADIEPHAMRCGGGEPGRP